MAPLLIAIGGKSGSGKTNIAQMLTQDIKFCGNVIFIGMDNFYKDTGGDMKYNYDHPDAFNWDAIIGLLKKIKQGQDLQVPVYNYANSCHSGDYIKYVGGTYDCVIFEGILALHNNICKFFNICIYIDADSDICLWRRLIRDFNERGRSLEDCGRQYFTMTKSGARAFVEPMKKNANFVLANNYINDIDELGKSAAYEALIKYIRAVY